MTDFEIIIRVDVNVPEKRFIKFIKGLEKLGCERTGDSIGECSFFEYK